MPRARTTTIAAAAAMAVLRKFSMSLFRIPGASSVAPSRLSASEPIVAPATTASERRPRNQPDRDGDRREKAGAGDAGDGSLERHRTRRARAPRAERWARGRCVVPTPCRSRWRSCRSRRRRARRRRPGAPGRVRSVDDRQQRGDRRETGIGDRVPSAAASASFLGDAEKRLAAQAQPRADRGRQECREQQHPARPAGRDGDRDADDRRRSPPPAAVTVPAR